MLTAASRRIEACCSLVQADDGGYVRQLVRQTLSKRGEIVMMPKMRKFHKTTSKLESLPMRFAMGFKSILKKHSYFYAHISFPKLTNNSKTRKEQGRRNFPPFRDRSHPSLIVCSKLTVLGLSKPNKLICNRK